MKAFTVLLVTGALLLVGAVAFASTDSRPIQNERSVTSWIGKSATQVVGSLGQPSYRSRHGGRVYYDYVVAPQHVGPIETYQFIVGPTGKVDAAKVLF